MMSINDGRQHYRITGPVENFITATAHGMWALNENNVGIWDRIQPGDICYFHATGASHFFNNRPGIIGYGIVGAKKWEKSNLVWLMEIKDDENAWPYAFNFSEVHLFCGSTADLDLHTPIEQRTEKEAIYAVNQATKGALPLADLNDAARSLDASVPYFPYNGSCSTFNPLYLTVLEAHQTNSAPLKSLLYDSHIPGEAPEDSPTRRQIEKTLAELDAQELLNAARAHESTNESHRETSGKRRVRIEDQKQKSRIAHIEKHTCQVCSFKCEYEHKDGPRYIIEIDHILPKSEGGDEHIDNLWALCPNCHTKKTRGIITLDQTDRLVTERGEEIIVRNHHLSWLPMTEGVN